MKIKQENWYGLDPKLINEKFEGGLTYCNTFCVKGNYSPSAVFICKKPNKSKGHKKYMLITKDIITETWWVSGMTSQEMKKERYQQAVICLECKNLIYSINRHHFLSCGCSNETSVDGGKDYLKISSKTKNYKIVTFDLIKNKVVK